MFQELFLSRADLTKAAMNLMLTYILLLSGNKHTLSAYIKLSVSIDLDNLLYSYSDNIIQIKLTLVIILKNSNM